MEINEIEHSVEPESDKSTIKEKQVQILAEKTITYGALYSEDSEGNRTYYFSAPLPK
jgi:hypothetical protein